jgi:PKD repeat protein
MRNLYVTIVLTLFCLTAFGSEWINIRSQQPVPAKTELVSSDITTSIVHFSLDGYFVSHVKTQNGDESIITLGNATPIMIKGAPDLPKMTASLIIPDADIMDVEVTASSYTDYEGVTVAPSKGNLTRDIDPATVAYEYGRPYSENSFFPARQAELRDPYILRDYRGQTVVVYPFAYNPVTKVLRVYTELTVKVYSKGHNGINTLNRSHFPARVDNDFKTIYNRRFLNSTNTDYTPLGEYGKMLVISYGSFMDAMQPFVNWKNQMGIQTEMVDVATIGNTASAIKTFVANYYNNNGLTFLLLVGDAAQIVTNTSGSIAGPSDNAYGYIVGNDHYPDIFVGRFSAETVDHVNTMVQRTLEYEKTPDVSTDWFSQGIGIGSDQGPGDDGEYDYQHIRNIRDDLLGFTYTAVAELYDGNQGGEDLPGNPTPAMVASFINPGTGIINYCGHGSDQSWGTTGFSNTNVNQLTNNHMWPFIFSVACVNGNFPGGTCFAEAWLRAKNSTGPTGAIATFMSTINQSWNPPMEGEDEMDDILVETYPNNIKRTFGGITINGCYKMNDSYGSDGADMTDTWTIFGDPSLNVYTAMPQTISATHEGQIFLGSTEFVVNADAEGALVGLSLHNQLLNAGFISGGEVALSFPALEDPDTVQLVITGFNRLTYTANIPVIPNSGPYLVYNTHAISDAAYNNNGLADYGETDQLSLALRNIGVLDAENVNVTVSTTDEYIQLTDSTETCALIPAGDTVTIVDGFAFHLPDNIPDLHTINFHYIAESDANSWSGNFSVTAHAGVLQFGSFTINDASGNNNGMGDPGEIFDVVVNVKNNGTAEIKNVAGQISFNDQYLTLLSANTQDYGDIPAGESVSRSFTVQADGDTPAGHVVPSAFAMNADQGLEASSAFSVVIGQIPVAVIDLDQNKNSGPSMIESLQSNNIFAQYLTSMPSDLSGYQSLFVSLGTGSKKHVLTSAEGQLLADFLNNGGKLYMEGADTWYYDPKTAVHSLFMINGVMDGSNDLAMELGQTGSFTEGLTLSYDGDNEFIDHIAPTGTAFNIYKNNSPYYITAVAYDAGTYKTIGSAFEFGGLVNGDFPATRDEYMHRIIDFFGILASPLNANFIAQPSTICDGGSAIFTDYSTGGATTWEWSFPGGEPATSTEQNPTVVYTNPGSYDVTLTIGNGTTTNTLLKAGYINVEFCTDVADSRTADVNIYPNPASSSATIAFSGMTGTVNLRITDALSKTIYSQANIPVSTTKIINVKGMPAGMYFVMIENNGKQLIRKLIVTK